MLLGSLEYTVWMQHSFCWFPGTSAWVPSTALLTCNKPLKVWSQLNVSFMFHFNRSAMVFSTLNRSLFNPTQRWLYPHPSTQHSSCSSYRHNHTSFSHQKFWFRMVIQDPRDYMSPISHLDLGIMIWFKCLGFVFACCLCYCMLKILKFAMHTCTYTTCDSFKWYTCECQWNNLWLTCTFLFLVHTSLEQSGCRGVGVSYGKPQERVA